MLPPPSQPRQGPTIARRAGAAVRQRSGPLPMCQTRAEEEEGAGGAEQARRAEPGVHTRTQERCPSMSGLPALSEQMP